MLERPNYRNNALLQVALPLLACRPQRRPESGGAWQRQVVTTQVQMVVADSEAPLTASHRNATCRRHTREVAARDQYPTTATTPSCLRYGRSVPMTPVICPAKFGLEVFLIRKVRIYRVRDQEVGAAPEAFASWPGASWSPA